MTFTPAEIRTLHAIATHGRAKRVEPKTKAATWTWRINGEPKSGPVDSLIRKRALTVSADKSTAALTALGREAIAQRRAA